MYKNYKDYSKKQEKRIETMESLIEKETAPQHGVDPEELNSVKAKIMKVSGCKTLNVRSSATSSLKNVLCTISEDDEVMLHSMGEEWSSICLVSGVEGFVMTKFLKEV